MVSLGQSVKKQREVASLTKIFTLYAACNFLQSKGIDPKTFLVEISYSAESRLGTTAWLEPGDKLCMYDLLFGLMLPSGNDAAVAISIAIGELLLEEKRLASKDIKTGSKPLNSRTAFLAQMHQECKNLGLKSSQFQNSHGLANIFNTTTAADTAKIFADGLKRFPLFKTVVTTK